MYNYQVTRTYNFPIQLGYGFGGSRSAFVTTGPRKNNNHSTGLIRFSLRSIDEAIKNENSNLSFSNNPRQILT